jgi:DNA-binding NarL/FixJ family response regulator
VHRITEATHGHGCCSGGPAKGAQPTRLASGQEAILAAAEHQPDLMLVDGDLKGEMDGIAAAVEIHNRLGIRSIVLAEQCDRTVRARAAEALPVAILDKTSPMSAIADALRMGAAVSRALTRLARREPAMSNLMEVIDTNKRVAELLVRVADEAARTIQAQAGKTAERARRVT